MILFMIHQILMIVIQVCPTTVQQKKEKVRPNAHLAVRALNSTTPTKTQSNTSRLTQKAMQSASKPPQIQPYLLAFVYLFTTEHASVQLLAKALLILFATSLKQIQNFEMSSLFSSKTLITYNLDSPIPINSWGPESNLSSKQTI